MSGKGGRRPLRDEERTLWDAVTKSVAPLRRRKPVVEPPSVEIEAPAEKPRRKASAVAPQPPRPSPPPVDPPRLAPLDRRLKQKVARGKEPLDARIDLHGMTQRQAHHALVRFLHTARRDGARMALVITGKGARAGGDLYGERGVLKRQVPLWLESAELRPLVIGFEDAGRGHGGQGALYVRLRKVRG